MAFNTEGIHRFLKKHAFSPSMGKVAETAFVPACRISERYRQQTEKKSKNYYLHPLSHYLAFFSVS
jgi:hypothetical protein